MLSLEEESQQVFIAAVFTLDSGKSVDEIATIPIPLHNLFDMGAKEAVSPFEKIFIDLIQGFKVVSNTAIERGLFGRLWLVCYKPRCKRIYLPIA